MDKCMRISEFLNPLFGRPKTGQQASEIVEGILKARSPRLSDIANAMPGHYAANYKQIQRFLANHQPKEQLQLLFNEEAEFVIADPTEITRPHAYKTEYVGTLKDGRTKGFWMLTFATPLRGRAIPFHFLTYSSRTFEEQVSSRNLEHHKAIQEIMDVIGDRPLVFDREFSYLELLSSMVEAGVQFVVRLDLRANPPHFYYDAEQKRRLRLRIPPNGQPKAYRQVYYMGQVRLNVIGIWNYGFKDPIWIMTTLEPEKALDLYFKRMKIESSFRDLKSLLQMDKVMNKSQHLLEKMLALVLIAYAICVFVGEALRDVQYARVEPGALDFFHVPKQDRRSKWHSFSGPFLLLKRRYRLSPAQLREIIQAVLSIFLALIFGNPVRSLVRT